MKVKSTGRGTFKFTVSETAKSADHDAPRSRRLRHDADEEVPQFLQHRPPHCNHPSLTTEWHVNVDARRFEQLAAWVRARSEEPALVGAEAVRAEKDAGSINRIQQRCTHASWRRENKWWAIRHRATADITTSGWPHFLGWRRRPKTGQRAAGQRQCLRPTTAGVDGKTQVFEELRPAAEWNEVGDCLLWYNLQKTSAIEREKFNIASTNSMSFQKLYTKNDNRMHAACSISNCMCTALYCTILCTLSFCWKHI